MNDQQTANGNSHTILLGGIGGDSHSVGLSILRQALTLNKYKVRYLGTQNSLANFFQLAPMCDAVMISSMDGHTRYYLRDFPELMKQYQIRKPLWYLGGNLHIGDACGYEGYFREMGFDRVLVKFVDIRTVLETLARDLDGVERSADCPTLWQSLQPVNFHLPASVSDYRLDLATFERTRREVLAGWKTGYAAQSLDENAEFLSVQPSFPQIQALANSKDRPLLLQPRAGVPGLKPQVKLFKALRSGGAGVLSYQVDSLTRNNNYAGAEEAVRESELTGVATINGFPIITHGVEGLRRVISSVRVPLQARHSTRDPRLLAEISYA